VRCLYLACTYIISVHDRGKQGQGSHEVDIEMSLESDFRFQDSRTNELMRT